MYHICLDMYVYVFKQFHMKHYLGFLNNKEASVPGMTGEKPCRNPILFQENNEKHFYMNSAVQVVQGQQENVWKMSIWVHATRFFQSSSLRSVTHLHKSMCHEPCPHGLIVAPLTIKPSNLTPVRVLCRVHTEELTTLEYIKNLCVTWFLYVRFSFPCFCTVASTILLLFIFWPENQMLPPLRKENRESWKLFAVHGYSMARLEAARLQPAGLHDDHGIDCSPCLGRDRVQTELHIKPRL